MTAALPTYAPEFAIRINGDPIPAALRGCVVSVTYTDGMEGADRVDVTVANISLQWLENPLLAVDNDFRLSIGYAPGPLEEVFVGTITGVEASFPGSGIPTMRITAQDHIQRMQQGTKDRAFRIAIPTVGNFPLPDAAVAMLVSGLDGLIPAMDPIGGAISTLTTLATFLAFPQFAQMSVRKQVGQSDFEFLSQIAKENGWSMYIDHTAEPHGSVLKFQFLIQDYSADVHLKWGASLMDFTPRITTVGDIAGVSVRVWVDSLKMEFVINVSWDYDRAALKVIVYPSLVGDLSTVIGEEEAKKNVTVSATGYATAPRSILSELLPRLNNRLTGSGSCIGNPRLKASKVVDLQGLGSQFSGLYRLTTVTHTFDSSGYRSTFQARKEVWFGSIPLPNRPLPLRLQGQFSI
jgi:phage protein D